MAIAFGPSRLAAFRAPTHVQGTQRLLPKMLIVVTIAVATALVAVAEGIHILAAGGFAIVFGALCLLASGSYIHTVWGEWQLVLPGVALHLWLIGALGSEVLQLSWASGIDYDQAIVTIQQRLESLRQLNLRALRVLFLTGVPVWSVAFPVVIVHALFGVDLNQWFGSDVLLIAFLGHALLGWAVVWACGRLAQRFSGVPGVQQAVCSLAGYNLMQAEARLAALAEFERDLG